MIIMKHYYQNTRIGTKLCLTAKLGLCRYCEYLHRISVTFHKYTHNVGNQFQFCLPLSFETPD